MDKQLSTPRSKHPRMLRRWLMLLMAVMWIGWSATARAAEDKTTTGANAPRIDLANSTSQLNPGTSNSFVIRLKWYNYDNTDSYWKTKPTLNITDGGSNSVSLPLEVQYFNEDKRDEKPSTTTLRAITTQKATTTKWGRVYARTYGEELEADQTGLKNGWINVEVTFEYLDVTSIPKMSISGTWVYYNNKSDKVTLDFGASISTTSLGLPTSGTMSAPASHTGQFSSSFTASPTGFSKFVVIDSNTTSTLPNGGIQEGSLTSGTGNSYAQKFPFDDNYNGGTYKVFVGQKVSKTITGIKEQYKSGSIVLSRAVSETINQHFYRSLGTQTLKGAPKVETLYAPVYNQWDKNVKLEWKKTSPKNVNDDGKFVIWRTTSGSFTNTTRLGDTSSTSFTDNTVSYGYDYYYWVSYVPKGWKEELVSELSAGPTAKTSTTRSYSIDLTGEVKTSTIDLKWVVPAITGTSDVSGLKFQLMRNGTKVGEVAVTSKTQTVYTYTDNQVPASCQALTYQVSPTAMEEQEFKSQVLSLSTDESRVLALTASKGNFAGMVKLQWTAKQTNSTPTNYVIYRKEVNAGEDKYLQISTLSGTATNYSFDDTSAEPGSYYTYRIGSSYQCESGPSNPVYVFDEGFCRGTGVVSGTITYGSGTAVSGVKVTLTKNDNTTVGSQFNSLYFDGSLAQIYYGKNNGAKDVQSLFAKGTPFSIQLWANPSDIQTHAGTAFLFDLPHASTLSLVVPNDKANTKLDSLQVRVTAREGTKNTSAETGIYVNTKEWSHFTFTHDGNGQFNLIVISGDSVPEVKTYEWTRNNWSMDGNANSDCIFFNYAKASYIYSGYLDEIRVWSGKALTSEEVLSNYNHPLNGNEEGLAIYWPLDEGIHSPKTAFDYSRTAGVNNSRHGQMTNCQTSTAVPTAHQFSLHALTDAQGNYTINSIPFAGQGTTYMITPTMGIHKFNPTSRSRFFSANSLVYSGVDFQDESSFEVSGVVYYENTNYPVKDCQVYIDNVAASRKGEAVMTNENGEFVVDVPIGKHSISVKKSYHTFADGGRWPADPQDLGLTYTFESPVTGVTFFDNTLVTVAGRVTGGVVEEAKPLGFGESQANIGQATLELYTSQKVEQSAQMNLMVNDQNGAAYTFEGNTAQLNYGSATSDVNSEAYTPAYNTNSPDAVKKIVIKTDPETGEFAVKLPPIQYFIHNVKIDNNPDITFSKLPTLDATQPMAVFADSTEVKGADGTVTKRKFEYVASAKLTHREPTTFIVTDGATGNAAFGEKKYSFTDEAGNSCTVDDIYTVDNKGNVTYTYDYPIYLMMDRYTMNLEAYEEYHNNDADAPEALRSTRVPLDSVSIDITNALGAGTQLKLQDGNTEVYEAAQATVVLDKEGKGKYSFKCSVPNIDSNANYALQISMDYGSATPWTMSAVVLGAISTGSNMLTAGPDKVTMIIRDPGGSFSNCTWEEGVELTSEYTNGFTYNESKNVSGVFKTGVTLKEGTGVGVVAISEVNTVNDIGAGIECTIDEAHNTKNTITTRISKSVSTSEDPLFVGANGDVFVGVSTNYLLGKATNVGFYPENDGWKIGKKEVLGLGTQYSTTFHYDQAYIENYLIPHFIDLRNSILQDPETTVNTATLTEPVYVSNVKRDDPNWGLTGSYTIHTPAKYAGQDTIAWCNMQVSTWEKRLEDNERAKVMAMQNESEYLIDNYSFSGGAGIEQSIDTTTVRGWHNETAEALSIITTYENAFLYNETGILLNTETHNTLGYTHTEDKDSTHVKTFTFVLAEEGSDALSMNVYRAPDGFGPIFVTKAGQTSCPYEDEVVTSYYEPGQHVLSAKTWQIEKVKFNLIEGTNTTATGVPAGSQALFRLGLLNESETNDDNYYGIAICEDTNTKHAGFTLNGNEMGDYRTLLLKAGETQEVLIGLNQTDESELDYERVGIRVFSLCQMDNTGYFPAIADTVYLTAHFQPMCSDIQLALSSKVVNTTLETPAVTLTASGYDINAKSLQGVRLEIRPEGVSTWTTLQEYVKQSAKVDANHLLLPESKLTYNFDMSDAMAWPDQTYEVRAVTVCDFGEGEELGQSTYQTLVRDMARPQLIALPSPADGVLEAGEEISITFNEDILASALNKTANFVIQGELNGYTITHQTALQLSEGAVAKTDARISLGERPLAINLWIRYTEGGTFLSHGADESTLILSIDATGHLVADVAGESLTSTNTLPADTWCFLSVSIDEADGAYVLNANYASDASDEELFASKAIPTYQGSGSLTLGGGMTGQLQELSLWDYARTWVESQSEMYQSKNRYTSGLIGYWPLNEGHGTTATDHARSRDLTMKSGSWYLADKNLVLELNGTQAAAIPVGSCVTQSDESYLVETWFRAEPAQTGAVATVFGWGDGAVEFRLNSGKPQLLVNNSVVGSVQGNYLDGKWHHVAFNVLKGTLGSAILYLDGLAVRQVPASSVPAFQADYLLLGAHRTTVDAATANYTYSNLLKGGIDEVRVWRGNLTADFLQRNMHQRVAPESDGLIAYYPMEKQQLDAALQSVCVADFADHATEPGGVIQLLAGIDPQITGTTAPALKSAPLLKNASFTYVASERKILITLTDAPATLEGCTVNFTVRNVYDMHSNICEPISWSALVRQNQLLWGQDDVSVRKVANQATTFTVDIVNSSASAENWTLSGLPSWLSTSVQSGTLAALTTRTLTFTVNASAAVGKYEATLYLTGSKGFAEPLVVTLNRMGETPDWEVNPADYENSMAVIGQLKVNGIYSNDTEDIIAAFDGNRCVGVAHPTYIQRYDASFVMMNVYGNAQAGSAPLTFKVYDASTGKVCPSVLTSLGGTQKQVTFTPNALVGSYAKPFVWEPDNRIEQEISYVNGWVWRSLYTAPTDSKVSTLFANATSDIVLMKDASGFTMPSANVWEGTLTQMETGKSYMIKANKAGAVSLLGESIDNASTEISVAAGWTWLGYTSADYLSPDAAFADLEPVEGDVLKSQSQFAIYCDPEWIGTLQSMNPGEGYLYQSQASSTKTFHYPTTSGSRQAPARAAQTASELDYVNTDFSGNMSVVARVMSGAMPVDDAVVSIFDQAGVLRSRQQTTVHDGLFFLTIPGETNGQILLVSVEYNGKQYLLDQTLTFRGNAVIGGVSHPHELSLNGATGLQSLDADAIRALRFNAWGQRIRDDQSGLQIELDENGARKVIR